MKKLYASCKLKLKRPYRPPDVGGAPMTHAALPRCMAVEILWKKKNLDSFSPPILIPICLMIFF